MLSVPYSRYIIYPIPWYSFLIVLGVAVAIFLASREERRFGIKKDTVIDLALWLLPAGITGARVYYVVFSWDQFRSDPMSVFKVWEGGIAIYGGVFAGLIVIFCFSRSRRLSPFLLCDLIAPGLVLAQGIGRWGNYFNMEAYGLPLHNPTLCFFPFAVQIAEKGSLVWHMATFFYESVWDLLIFFLLLIIRRKPLRRRGDLFLIYAFLYASGRFVIEDLRMDSLLTSASIRISQFLSALFCISILLYYLFLSGKAGLLKATFKLLVIPAAFVSSGFQLCYSLSEAFLSYTPLFYRIILLAGSSVIMIALLYIIYQNVPREDLHADNQI